MSAEAMPLQSHHRHESGVSHIKAGMVCFLVSEAAFFSTLIVAYVTYLGTREPRDMLTPGNLLGLFFPLIGSFCLLSSSGTYFLAERALRHELRLLFQFWLLVTILLGVSFLVVTGMEWRDLIAQGLTIRRNMFGTTYYTLLGFHGFHVTLGILTMLLVLSLALRGHVRADHSLGVEMVGWYWHFVDGVWVVIFTIVYLVGR